MSETDEIAGAHLYIANMKPQASEPMNRKIQLLAPGGDLNSIEAAVAAGADAVYCGLDRFNARNRAANIRFEDLNGILRLAHKHGCRVFLTLNIIIVESEIPALIRLLNRLVDTNIDGVIVQDLGLLYLLSRHFSSLEVHASTQLTTHNEGQIRFLKELAVARANLCRELTIDEIRRLTSAAHANGLGTEVFVHGSYCICFSGICYMSSVHGGNSGNRGRCSQPCRARYVTTPKGIDFPLNLRDNSAYFDLETIADAGVDSLKIEGRMKEFHYVYTVVDSFRKQLQNLCTGRRLSTDNSELHKVFNRDFSAGFLRGSVGKEMFINNPMNHSAIHLSEMTGDTNDGNLDIAKKKVLDEKTRIVAHVQDKIETLSVSKAPLTVTVSKDAVEPVDVPAIEKPGKSTTKPVLSVLISSQADLDLCSETADVHFQLPSSFGSRFPEFAELFTERRKLVPWFPSILIGEDYRAAVEFLEHVRPELVVTNNTGVAHEARRRGIAWLAGPYLNIANSYSLLCLKERFDCSGAFISDELSRSQIGGIKSPGDFKMFYSIYHPILLMTSRQCLFHQVIGCEKDGIDDECVPICSRSSSITNLDNDSVYLEKRPGNYHCLYNNCNFLNTDIVTDMPGRFSRFMVDLRDIRTGTRLEMGKAGIIRLFEEHLDGNPDAGVKLKQAIHPTVDAQYRRGI